MLKMVKVLRVRISHKVGHVLESGEGITHFLYGTAIIVEHHWEWTFYSVSALGLGCFALLTVVVGGRE